MSLAGKQRTLLDELRQRADAQSRLALVVERGRRLPPLPENQRVPENLVPGCLSRLWLVMEYRDGLCHFACDSDSAVVKGIAGLLCEFYSGHTPREILAHDAAFLSQAGLTQHLTANRRNGLGRVQEMIRDFASARLSETSTPPD
jgi:cysteine desulfuration protein SufE